MCFTSKGMKVGKSSSLFYHIPQWSLSRSVAGAVLHYTMKDYVFPDKINIVGTLNEDISIYVS